MKSVITKENVGLLLNGVRGLVINDIEKVKILNDFFSVFTHKTGIWESQALETKGKV